MHTTKVFVYGTLKSGCSNFHRFKDKLLGIETAQTKDIFQLQDSEYGFPFMYKTGEGTQVSGEVHTFLLEVLQDLDYFENEGELYNREYIEVVNKNNEVEKSVLLYCQ